MVGQTREEGAFFYRLTMNAFNNGQYDDNFLERKLPHLLPVMSRINTKLFPITKQVKRKMLRVVYIEQNGIALPPIVLSLLLDFILCNSVL